MTISQLSEGEIKALELKAKGIRDQIPEADYLKALELSYQATRIETWVSIQKGNNPHLKAKIESLPEGCDPRTGLIPKTEKAGSDQISHTRQYTLHLQERPMKGMQRVYEEINRRSVELKKMPQRIKFR